METPNRSHDSVVQIHGMVIERRGAEAVLDKSYWSTWSRSLRANNLFACSCDSQHAFLVTSNHNNSKNHYNNSSGDKQSNSQTLIPLTAIPHKEDCHEQRNGEATDNNAKCYLGNQCHW